MLPIVLLVGSIVPLRGTGRRGQKTAEEKISKEGVIDVRIMLILWQVNALLVICSIHVWACTVHVCTTIIDKYSTCVLFFLTLNLIVKTLLEVYVCAYT